MRKTWGSVGLGKGLAGGEDSAVSAAGAAEGLGLLSGSRKHCSWGVVGWTLVALTAEPWTIKQEMFSLGENLTHYTAAAVAHRAVGYIVPTLCSLLSSLIAVWPRKSEQGGIICWPSGCQ